ncbi:hypothetical protein HZU73_02269 [Apis mellifera caucasica]|uniref:Uncharacterized protein LOC102656461 n=1 Tax=Apis mellifera TaxID=7460 RepID=A0A7M7GTH1_APIME|nr:uncharacterized protein LOC102656461 [Apis mellifera]KAG6802363.1 hypothetical protein HZU73_02269 [Apis mellifera caucasica]KAG9435615.1 hypothetical protein HZU67_02038 [Apis mellifera carnica]|eukprot:XP_006559000.1 uncharacterized protein LOC102656461 [Apis mellifera]
MEERTTYGSSRNRGILCKFEVRVVPGNPLCRPRRRRLPGGIRESFPHPSSIFTISTPRMKKKGHRGEANEAGGTDRKSCNTVVGRRYGLPTGAYRYTQALCRTEVEYGLYWRHLLHG